jgi:hypothetical protein
VSLRKVAALLAASGLIVGLIGSGVGAQFYDSVTANEHINVGTFSCVISDATPGASGVGTHSVSYTAPDITSSAPASAPFFFTVHNTGSIADVLTVSTSPVSSPFSIIGAPFGPVHLAGGATHTYDTGVQWGELDNSWLGQTGTVTWTVNCNEEPGFNVAYYAVNDGGSYLASGTWVRSTLPIASTAVVGGGTATQSIGGGVNLSITGGGPYADNGFYVPLGTLSSLASSGYSVTGTGSDFGTNVYFDVDNNGEFFGWTSNSLSSVLPDAYGLGPTSVAGTLTVTGASTYAMTCNGVYGNYSLTTLATSGCSLEGITGATNVAVWVGITSTGSALSTTITSAP